MDRSGRPSKKCGKSVRVHLCVRPLQVDQISRSIRRIRRKSQAEETGPLCVSRVHCANKNWKEATGDVISHQLANVPQLLVEPRGGGWQPLLAKRITMRLIA
jgi:hypothetical protein